jgi:hypothetical protein
MTASTRPNYRLNPWTPLLPMLLLFLTICATSAEDVTSGQAPASTTPASALPEAAVAILTSEHDQEAALRAKLDQDLGRLHQAAIVRLKRVEDRALSAKDLDGAEAVKAAIVALSPKAEPAPADIQAMLTGTANYTMANGHCGQLTVKGGIATDSVSGVSGTVQIHDSDATIVWGNGTAWHLTTAGDAITFTAPDSTGTLSK